MAPTAYLDRVFETLAARFAQPEAAGDTLKDAVPPVRDVRLAATA